MNYITLADETVLGIVDMIREFAALSDLEMEKKIEGSLAPINHKTCDIENKSLEKFLSNLDKYLEGESPTTKRKFYQTVMYLTARLTA